MGKAIITLSPVLVGRARKESLMERTTSAVDAIRKRNDAVSVALSSPRRHRNGMALYLSRGRAVAVALSWQRVAFAF